MIWYNINANKGSVTGGSGIDHMGAECPHYFVPTAWAILFRSRIGLPFCFFGIF